ncbi:MAG: hypothetical protein JSW00_01805 [Thermoplasmata archaeon]|nr:MAG: hypothetical protein JSW00_01805 [Thermoplasmata archaeon]
MRGKAISVLLCLALVAMALFVTPTAGDYDVKKVKKIPVPWQKWRIVRDPTDPTGEAVIGVEDIIFFDPPGTDDGVYVQREYAVADMAIPLNHLTIQDPEILRQHWVEIDPYPGALIPLNGEIRVTIPITDNDNAVLVRYSVAWESSPDVIEAHFINEAILERGSPPAIRGSLSNFDVHNDYHEPIDNFELELYGNIEPDDILYVYDPAGPPTRYNTSLGTVWYGGWGAPPQINTIPGGIEIEWIDPGHPVQPCEWIHFGVALRLEKKVKRIPAPIQFWRQFSGGVTDFIVYEPEPPAGEPHPEPAALLRDFVVLQDEIPLDDLTWDGTEMLPWEEIDVDMDGDGIRDPAIMEAGDVLEYDIPTNPGDRAVLVRYTVAFGSTPNIIEGHFVNEAIIEANSTPTIVGQLVNFDVHNDYHEKVDNFELELFGVQPSDIDKWYWKGKAPSYYWVNKTWGPTLYGGWGTPPHITWLPSGKGTEIIWKDPDHPIEHCEWVHFGVWVKPGTNLTGVRAYWTQTLQLWGAKAYLTQLIKLIPADIEIHPETLNLKSNGKWVSCIIKLPDGYDEADIDPATMYLESIIPAENPTLTGDSLNVKFDRGDLEDLVVGGGYGRPAEFKVTGQLIGGMSFEGSDTVRIIH